MQRQQQQESSLQQRLGFVQQYHKNHPNTFELKPPKEYKTLQNLKYIDMFIHSRKPKELEEQPKSSLMDNLNRINNLYKAASQPRIDAKEINPPQYFYNHKQGCQNPQPTTGKAIKENQIVKTFLNNNELSLKDYDLQSTKGNAFTAKSTSPINFSVNKSPLNKVARTDSVLGSKKTNEPVVTFLKGVY
ncbi:unnamed protein product (macronuclear) [Paramecium tetraurelia]|uniref:Uncharacterized protein n=1 Tax=Paramecium tetraurelia TaxID=5888 RepID=A0EH50_PARTE|nr:uncharacterized protein GSPATT00026965001 [Paramecium tetraurelia]CAK94641.1 unnamed protein product [Paramecium tetraurelia]|eukprot:XP_001462014.1 hypothetical protein (macronuclear) [Paramecium tetraurelia strain d4-2]